MSRFEALKDPLARAIDRAVHEVLESELPGALLQNEAVSLLAEAQADSSAKLVASAARIDQASSQGALLMALLEEAQGYGSRSAFFVAKEHGVEGWSSSGFRFDAEDLAGRHFGFGREPFAQLRSANGGVRVDGDDIGLLATAVGTAAGAEGVFLPFVLRNELAGFLYVERDESEPALDVATLRLLTHLAGLSIETLPTRSAGVSPALRDHEAAESSLVLYAAAATVVSQTLEDDGADIAPSDAEDQTAAEAVVETTEVVVEAAESATETADTGDAPVDAGLEVEAPADSAPVEEVAAEDSAVEAQDDAPMHEPSGDATADELELATDGTAELPEQHGVDDTVEFEKITTTLVPEPVASIEALDETVVETPAERRPVAADETYPVVDAAADLDLAAPAAEPVKPAAVAAPPAADVSYTDGAGNDTQATAPPITVRPEHSSEVEELFGEETVTEQIQVDASFPRIRSDAEVAREEEGEPENDTLELEPIDPSLIQHDEQALATDVSNAAGPVGSEPAVDPTAPADQPPQEVAFELDDSRFATPSPQQTVRLDLDQLESQVAAPPPAARIDAALATTAPSEPAREPAIEPNAHSEDATLMAERSAVYRPPAEPADPPASARKSTEVAPPADLSGPGSAFTAGGSDGDQALREEARRLARLLVSEIKLYNEDQLEEGRREGNIYNRLREDIDRSRKMYHERIDPRLTDADDHFHQELVDRLAGGNTDLLGM